MIATKSQSNGTYLFFDRKQSRQNYPTPKWLFDRLHRIFHFTVDAAASPENAKLPRYWTEEQDALQQDWSQEVVFCNPPFNNIPPFLAKARTAKRAVVVFPLNSLTSGGFHECPPDHLLIPQGRIKYVKGSGPTFGTGILVYGPLSLREQQALGWHCMTYSPLANLVGKIHHLDAFSLLQRIPSGTVDAVMHDPMFGKRMVYDSGPDPSGGDPVKHWAYHGPIYHECLRVLKPGGVLAWANAIGYAELAKSWLGPHGQWVLFRKTRGVNNHNPQMWLVQTKEREPVPPPSADLGIVVVHDRLPEPPQGYPPHPCPKPWEELAVLIKALTKPGQVILDCFCGTGSTLVAAERLGRLWIGCDKSRYYCQLAMREVVRARRNMRFKRM